MGVAPRPPAKVPELRRLARGGALNLVGYIVSGILSFALAVVVTRLVGARGAGIFFAAIAVFTILANITELGADTGVVRFVARLREQDRRGDLRPLMWIALVPSVAVATVAGLATVVWAAPIAGVLSRSNPAEVASYLRIFGWFIPPATAATVALAATRGFGTMRPFVAIQSIATPALKPILILLAAIGGLTMTGLALGWAIPEALACAAALVVMTRRVGRAGGQAERASASLGSLAKEFWAFSAPRGLAAAFQITIIWFDLLLLSHLRDASEVGIYGAASRAVVIGTFALQAIRLAIAPQISRLLARGDRSGAQTVYQTATWWLIVVSWPLFLTLAIFGPALLGVFGPGFDQGATALAILSAAMLVNLGTGNVTVVLLMGGKSSWNLLNTAVALTLNIGLNLVLIPHFGMRGAAIAWAVSIVVDNLMALTEVWLFLGMRPFGEGYLPAVAAAVGCFGAIGLIARALFGTTGEAFGVFLVVALPMYAAALWRLRRRLHLDELVAAFGVGARARPGEGNGWAGGGGSGGGRRVRAVARHGARAWSMMTAPLRRAPDILVIGTKRGGTTSLAAYLYEHPQVLPPVPARLAPKGVRAFDEHPDRGGWWYRSHFATVFVRGPVRARRRFAAESTANYLFHPEQAARAAQLAPQARVVVLLRDPIDRAWSHWRERTRRGLETLSFEDALAAEPQRLRTLPASERANIAYRTQGCYAELLPAWQAAFGDRLLVVFADDLFADPPAMYARVIAFLGLRPYALARYDAWNQHPSSQSMDPQTRAELASFYAPFDRHLERVLGRTPPWGTAPQAVPPEPQDR
ncbi:MAG: oligosaccharide flippase family protein [Actinomycetota bacterium]